MNKQIDNKAIEEMAKICTDKCQVCHNTECRKTTKSQYCIAEALYNAGYKQPIKDNDIVLSKAEYNKILESKEPLRGWIYRDGFNDGREVYAQLTSQLRDDIIALKQENKETAREILQWLVDTGLIEQAPDTTKTHFKEKYGVEVK